MGFKSAGKTTFGSYLSQKLKLPFYDLDHQLLQENPSCGSINELFFKMGEEKFRQKEREIFLKLMNRNEGVFSIGAGAFDLFIEKSTLLSFPIRLFIDINYAIAKKRILQTSSYPYKKNLYHLYRQRKKRYLSYSTHSISIQEDPVEDIYYKFTQSTLYAQ
jgi:shikimate kinase